MSPVGSADRLNARLAAGTARRDGVHLRGSRSLQARITAAILLTAIAVLFVGCTLFMLEQHRAERMAIRRTDQQLVETLGAGSVHALVSGDGATVQRNLDLLAHFDPVAWGEMTSVDGRRFVYRRGGAHETGPFTLYRSPLAWDGRPVGQLTIAVAPVASKERLGRYLAMGGALFFAATALALFMGRWLAGRITTPVARLAEAMETVGRSGAFAIRLEPDTADEIGRLTIRFNDLMARLEVKDAALRRTLDELVEARDAAEAANLAKSQFLANISHEIRTPLNGVLAMAQILARSPLQAVQQDQVQVIRQSGETLLSLLNDILDVSKIEAGKLETETAEFDLEAVVHATAAAFGGVAERKGLDMQVEIAPQGAGWRSGDAARLRQILNNFISNALKFTEAGGVRVRVDGEGEAGATGVRITVQDSGIGIPTDKLPLLFQKFTQLDASTTRRFGGTGLGLAICRELAELMGGSVWVESAPGRGSIFGVALPLPRIAGHAGGGGGAGTAAVNDEPQTSEARPAADTPPDDAGASLRVLAAEDNATNQLVLTTVMQIFGIELTLAADGAEAVEAWRAGRFDLILMDIQMPRMDGVTATRLIRAEEAANGRPRTPILALSANALTHQVEQYLAAGMDGHVAKPIELAKLQAAIAAVFEGEAAAAAA